MVLMSGLGFGLLGAQDLKPLDDLTQLPPMPKPLGAIQLKVPSKEVWPETQLELLSSPDTQKLLNKLYGEPWWQNPKIGLNNPLLRELARTSEGKAASPPKWRIGIRVGPNEGKEQGVRVIGVVPNTPAAEAHLRSGDRITKLNGLTIRDLPMLHDLIQIIQNQKISLKVVNGGTAREVELTPERQRDPRVARPNPEAQDVPIRPVPAKPVKPKLNPVPIPKRVIPLDPIRQLHKDNLETQRLLRQLIDEVKKIRD